MSNGIHWCPECDHGIEVDSPEVAAEAILTAADVQIAKIQAERDIALAKIQARIYTEEIQVEAATATARNEILEDVVEDLTAPDENVTIIANDTPESDEEPLDESEIAEAPPEIEPEPTSRKKSNWSYWGN